MMEQIVALGRLLKIGIGIDVGFLKLAGKL